MARRRCAETDAPPWDMAVVGAGPAGSVCACSALAAGDRMRVALVDRDRFPRDKTCGDAIRADAASIVRELGLGAVFDGRPRVLRTLFTSPPRFGYLEKLLQSGNADPDERGYYVIERRVFDRHLFEAAIGRGAEDYTGHTLTNAEFDASAGLWRLVLRTRSATNTQIRCRTLVGADGAGSLVRRLAGLECNADGHTAVAIRAYAQAAGLPERTMRVDWLESLLPGYGWTFPLADGQVNIGIIIDKRDFKRARRRLESYLEEYVRYLDDDGLAIRSPESIRTHPLPLGSQPLQLVPAERMALVGDAAAMINPFTGEGIHYGIWAGRVLGRAVGECVSRSGSPQAALQSYEKAYAERFGETMKRYHSLRNWVRFQKHFG